MCFEKNEGEKLYGGGGRGGGGGNDGMDLSKEAGVTTRTKTQNYFMSFWASPPANIYPGRSSGPRLELRSQGFS